ncbi:hypothetical protein VP1G_10646 [Cytospora mali]|uniref:Uncharacterized protein n=1 Tax=Cytospora mali TaxID=578113 RepID=A0A194UT80_CYTMA|nr:hypothetical protein VP1G_10646 [Valsa mali var. pyri (nom. inval.)]
MLITAETEEYVEGLSRDRKRDKDEESIEVDKQKKLQLTRANSLESPPPWALDMIGRWYSGRYGVGSVAAGRGGVA